MKTLFIDKKIDYDGSQLRSLYAYLEHGVLGPSIISFRGACNVSFDKMVDGEDLLEKSQICGSDMIHFIIEIFDEKLITGVFVQRLFASMVQNYIYLKTKNILVREGDDLYWDSPDSQNRKKLSISIATRSPNSVMVHFAVNCSNSGTPVPTCSLEDFGVAPALFAQDLLEEFSAEFRDIQTATFKVKSID